MQRAASAAICGPGWWNSTLILKSFLLLFSIVCLSEPVRSNGSGSQCDENDAIISLYETTEWSKAHGMISQCLLTNANGCLSTQGIDAFEHCSRYFVPSKTEKHDCYQNDSCGHILI